MEGAYPRYLKRLKTYSLLFERHLSCCKVYLKYSGLISEIHGWRILLSSWIKAYTPKTMLFLFKEGFTGKSSCNILKIDMILKSYKHKTDSSYSPHLPWTCVFLSQELASHWKTLDSCVSSFVCCPHTDTESCVLSPCLIAHSHGRLMSQTKKEEHIFML